MRAERVRKAWTQEELSERSNLALRTLRRLEAGRGSLESLRRVAEALDLEPALALVEDSPPPKRPAAIEFDTIRLCLSKALFEGRADAFFEALLDRLRIVRRHLGRELGLPLPGIRLNDSADSEFRYQIFVREKVVGQGNARPGGYLAVASESRQLAGLRREIGVDPITGNPAAWLDLSEHDLAHSRGCLLLSEIDLIAAHLCEVSREHLHRMFGVEAVAVLLDDLHQPRLVAEVVPGKVSLTTLRNLLRALLAQGQSIQDLAWILETLAEVAQPGMDAQCLVGPVVEALSGGDILATPIRTPMERLTLVIQGFAQL